MHGSFPAGFPVVLAAALVGCTERSASPPPPVPAPVVHIPEPPQEEPIEPKELKELKELPPVETDNRGRLVAAGAAFEMTASSTFSGWPTTYATDGNIATWWYSGKNDSAAKGAAPYLELEFAAPSTVRRVTILGNRDPNYLTGYTILAGKLDLLDAREKLIKSIKSKGTGNLRDFDFVLEAPISGVKSVRFTSLSDEGDKNPYGDVAIAEFQVE